MSDASHVIRHGKSAFNAGEDHEEEMVPRPTATISSI
jgi:hypothetical protein